MEPSQAVARTRVANYARDGGSIMTQRSQFNFVIRGLLLLSVHVCQQLPSRFQVQVNRDKFLDAFSMNHDGRSETAAAWVWGPDGPVRETEKPTFMQRMRRQLQLTHRAMYKFFARAMPMVPISYMPPPEPKGESSRIRF